MPAAWPTVPEVFEVLAPMAADTVLQILHGQGLAFGLGAAVEPAVYVPEYKLEARRKAQRRYRARRRLAARLAR
jgi:hypothetical protein